MEMKKNERRLTQKKICNQLGFSDSTIRRYRDDNNMDSLYNGNKYRKKHTQPNSLITQTESNTKSGKNQN